MNKQYLLVCSEEVQRSLQAVIKGLEFLEVQGLNLNNENQFNLLVTPVTPPVPPAFIKPVVAPAQEAAVTPISEDIDPPVEALNAE